MHALRHFILASDKNSMDLILLPSQYFSTQSLSQLHQLPDHKTELLYPLLIAARVLSYQPSCHNCYHLVIAFGSAGNR